MGELFLPDFGPTERMYGDAGVEMLATMDKIPVVFTPTELDLDG